MKKCREIQAELSAYIDNELPTATRVAVEEHVEDCGVCQTRLAEMKELMTGVEALPRLRPAPSFLIEVRRRITRDTKPLPKPWQDYVFRPLWLKIPLEAVAVVVIVLFVMRFERSVNDLEPSHKAFIPAEKPASTPVVSGATSHSIDKLAPNRLVGDAAPSPARGLQAGAAANVVTVHGKDFGDIKNHVQQLTAAMNGRIIPPSFGERSAHSLFVELPSENVDAFKSQLQSAAPLSAPRLLANGSNLVVDAAEHLERTPARVVLQIQVLPPAD